MGRSGFLIALLLVVLWAIPALAYEYGSPEYWAEREWVREGYHAAQEQMNAFAAELQAVDETAWTARQLENYYRSVVEYLYRQERLTMIADKVSYTLDSRRATKQGRYWPRDPLNNWEPLPIQDIADDPLPGGIVLQVCPAGRYSDPYRYCWPAARSYEISIYAPVGLEPGRARPRAGNRGWAVVRPEMLAMRGWFSPPYTVIRDTDYDQAGAAGNAEHNARQRAQVLAWYHENFPELPDGLNVHLDWGLQFMESVLLVEERLARLEEQYGGLPAEQWAAQDLDDWLECSMSMVYLANLAYGEIASPVRDVEVDLAVLQAGGFLPRVPPNPYDGGRPLRIVSMADGASPGDLCVVYPTSYWSGVCSDGLAPVMFQVFALGTETDAARAEELKQQMTFKDGTYTIPPGARHLVNTYTNGYLLNSDLRQVNCEA